MKIFTKSTDLKSFVFENKSKGNKIGFVPTMGALHQGHLSLCQKSISECETTIVSIFVNPTQFNNQSDYINYPIKTEEDLYLLKQLKIDAVFIPTTDEIYTSNIQKPFIDLGKFNMILEGEFRPGHFEGVTEVVYRLFKIVQPNIAYFGLKDFQQLAVIKHMVNELQLNIAIVACDTVREADGLAMSSRNLRLNSNERKNALLINKTLKNVQVLKDSLISIEKIKSIVKKEFTSSELKLEYFEIINADNFEILFDEWATHSVACIAAYSGEIRLIDNMIIKH